MDEVPTDALRELNKLTGLQHYHKRRNTLLALVDARLAGASEETVWQQDGTCSRNTWHMKWKNDSLMVDVLANVERILRDWTDGEELRALRQAARQLALGAVAAAEQLTGIAANGQVRYVVQVAGGEPLESFETASAGDVRLAAVAVLDRAGIETASKSTMQLTPISIIEVVEEEEDAAQ